MTTEALQVPALPPLDPAEALDLSIIIVNWNTRDLLADCLQSVYDTVHGLTFEVFVVDNASTDGSAEMVRERFPQVRLIENTENVGFARANNQAIRQSRGEYVLLLNSDTVLLPGAMHSLIDFWQGRPFVAAVGPTMLNPDGSLQNSYGSLPSLFSEICGPYLLDFLTKPWGARVRQSAEMYIKKARPKAVERVSFACVLIKREALDIIGSLDETYPFYSEDYDWFMRAKRAGWRVFHVPSAAVIHRWGGSSRRRPVWAMVMLYRSKRLYFLKHYGRQAELLLRLGLTLRFCLKILQGLVSRVFVRDGVTLSPNLYRTLLKDLFQPLRLENDVNI